MPLYCYRKINKYTIENLQNSCITLSDPKKFDDPIDCLVFPWMKKKTESTKTKGEKLAAKLINKAFSYVRITCFVRNTPLPSLANPNPESTEKHAEYSNTIMWPMYANYHRGICLEYQLPPDLQKADMSNEKTFYLDDVEYKNEMSLAENLTIKEGFFTKSSEWGFENETRLLYYDTSSTDTYKSIKLPQDCLKKVFFGIRCNKKQISRVIRALRDNDIVKFYQMKIVFDDIYSFGYEPIDKEKYY